MNTELFKGQYICYTVWTISSILFFFFGFYDWMAGWLKITVGIIQLSSVGYFTYGLYRAGKRAHFIVCLIAFLVDAVVTILGLNWMLSHSLMS